MCPWNCGCPSNIRLHLPYVVLWITRLSTEFRMGNFTILRKFIEGVQYRSSFQQRQQCAQVHSGTEQQGSHFDSEFGLKWMQQMRPHQRNCLNPICAIRCSCWLLNFLSKKPVHFHSFVNLLRRFPVIQLNLAECFCCRNIDFLPKHRHSKKGK